MNCTLLMAAWVVLLLWGCQQPSGGHPEAGANGHGHAHAPVVLSYTLFDEDFELFVEFRQLVVGQPTRFAAHLTHVPTYKPLEAGTVTLTLEGVPGQARADAPTSPGIFKPNFKPTRAGTFQLVFTVASAKGDARFVIDSVRVFADEHAAEHNAPPEPDYGPGAVTYLKEQAWRTEFAVERVQPRPFHELIATSGEVVTAPGDEVVVSASSAGIFRLAGGNLLAGSLVGAGQTLGVVSGTGMALENPRTRFQQASNNLEAAKAEWERAQRLMPDRLITRERFEQAKRNFENASADHANLNQGFSIGNQSVAVVATSRGFLARLWVADGQFVAAGQPIATLSANRRLLIRADVPQRFFHALGQISGATFRANQQHAAVDFANLNGKVRGYGRRTTDGQPFVPVFLEVDNTAQLLPGEFLEVTLRGQMLNQALSVASSALMEEQGYFYTYVARAGETYEKRRVQVGGTDGVRTEITNGLQPGEYVVTKGLLDIRLATQANVTPAHGHEH